MIGRRWDRQSCIVRLLGLVVLSCILVAGYAVWWVTHSDPFSSDSADPDFLEANTEIRFPPSAREIRAHTEGFREISTLVRFTMSPADLPQFLDSTLCSVPPALADPSLQPRGVGAPSWWRPMDAERLQECLGERVDFYQHVLVDVSNPNTYIVYVSAGTR